MGYKYCDNYHFPCVFLRLLDSSKLCTRRLVRTFKRPALAILSMLLLWRVAGNGILLRAGTLLPLSFFGTSYSSATSMARKELNLDSLSGNLVQNVRTKEVGCNRSQAKSPRCNLTFKPTQMVTLGSFWQEQAAVVMFMRRFG